MEYQVKRFTEGMLGSNTYLLWDAESRNAMVIDPGNPVDELREMADREKLTVTYIVLTHGHYDHVCYIEDYKKAFEAKVACTAPENRNLATPYLNASVLFGSAVVYEPGDLTVEDGYVFDLNGKGEGPLVIHTPGHTSGGICLLARPWLFTGDTLFYHSFGRTDLGDGSTAVLHASIDKLYAMEDDLIILPGHGTRSTIGHEREENPFWDF